jgi:ABC-type antimicrobial peptide transport system permease subunit
MLAPALSSPPKQHISLASTSNLMAALLLGVALISLLVGGVGIMNIMLVGTARVVYVP